MLLLLLLLIATASAKSFSVTYEGGHWKVHEGLLPNAVALAEWHDSRPVDGWTRLKVKITGAGPANKAERYFGAGFLEGHITQRLIFAGVYNFANSSTVAPLTPDMTKLIQAQWRWMASQVKAHPSDKYWQRVDTVMQQYDGIVAGYRSKAPSHESLSELQMMAYFLQFEIGDYAQAASQLPLVTFDAAGRRHATRPHVALETTHGRRNLMGEHCSVLIKPSGDKRKLLAGHVTWSAMNVMLRVYKTYDFPDGTVQFSGYPGLT